MPISFDWSKTLSELPGNPIPPEWLETKGKGVKLAFIDTGVNLGLASLSHLDKPGHKFFTGAPGFSVAKLTGQDLVGEAFGGAGTGHGTLYAALLAGKTPELPPLDKDLVSGIAPETDFYILKARNPNDKKTTIRNLLQALELSANLGVEIAITGQSVSASEMRFEGLSDAEVNRVFSLAGLQKMFVFAPLKNLEVTDSWDGICANNLPNRRPEVFNVATKPVNLEAVAGSIQTQPIHFLLSGFQGTVLSKTGDAVPLHFSNSGAVAVMGGIAALALSYFKSQSGGTLSARDAMLQLLGAICKPLSDAAVDVQTPALFKNF